MTLKDVYEKSITDELEECMFCHSEIDDQGLAFMEHIEDNPTCRDQYENWKVRLNQDWKGG